MWALLQHAAIADPLAHLPEMGVGGAIGVIIFYFYREDRKKSEDSLKDLSETFKEIVQENTKAITELREALRSGTIK